MNELENLNVADLQEIHDYLSQLVDLKADNPLDFFHPYPKQQEFFDLGAWKRERLFRAGNQCGKSDAGAFEAACHATGLYPEWWQGKRFDHPTRGWVCGESGTAVRDIMMYKLFGLRGDDSSHGMIPRKLMVGLPTLSHGTADLYDTVKIRHISGGVSTVTSKSYEQDSRKWQGTTLDWIAVDEECPIEHYTEALARLTGKGILWLTTTPLLGYSEVINRFMRDDSEFALRDRGTVQMGLKDALHFTPEEREKRLAAYPHHEREARANGDPTLGSGAVFDTPQGDLSIPTDFQPPLYYSKLWSVDFGITHPFAATLLAWDKDGDVVYVLETVRLSNSRPIEHCAAMKRYAPDVKVAWPHDGNRRESTLDPIVKSYRDHGMQMLSSHATFPDGSISTEAGVLEMQERMSTGRFKVKAHLADWWDEFRSYHRDNKGQLVKIHDDLMSATRIGIMALRYARPGPIGSAHGMARRTGGNSGMGQTARNVDYGLFDY